MNPKPMDWAAIDADPRFQHLHRRKSRFLWGLMIISVLYYFALPVGAGYFQELFRLKVWGPINVGLLFALSQFVMVWVLGWMYLRRADREFDPMAARVRRRALEEVSPR